MWALQRLRKLLTTEYGQSININRLLGDSEGETRSMVSSTYHTVEERAAKQLSKTCYASNTAATFLRTYFILHLNVEQ